MRTISDRCSSSPAAGAVDNVGFVLEPGDRIPNAQIFLGPNEPLTLLELVDDGPKLLVFYLFDWSST